MDISAYIDALSYKFIYTYTPKALCSVNQQTFNMLLEEQQVIDEDVSADIICDAWLFAIDRLLNDGTLMSTLLPAKAQIACIDKALAYFAEHINQFKN